MADISKELELLPPEKRKEYANYHNGSSLPSVDIPKSPEEHPDDPPEVHFDDPLEEHSDHNKIIESRELLRMLNSTLKNFENNTENPDHLAVFEKKLVYVTFYTSDSKKVVEMGLEENRALEQIAEKASQLFPTSKWKLFGENRNQRVEFTDSKTVMTTIKHAPIAQFDYLLVHLETVTLITVNEHNANSELDISKELEFLPPEKRKEYAKYPNGSTLPSLDVARPPKENSDGPPEEHYDDPPEEHSGNISEKNSDDKKKRVNFVDVLPSPTYHNVICHAEVPSDLADFKKKIVNVTFYRNFCKKVVEMVLEENRALVQISEKANELFPTSLEWKLYGGNSSHRFEFTNSKTVMASIKRAPICQFYYLRVYLKTVSPIIDNVHNANSELDISKELELLPPEKRKEYANYPNGSSLPSIDVATPPEKLSDNLSEEHPDDLPEESSDDKKKRVNFVDVLPSRTYQNFICHAEVRTGLAGFEKKLVYVTFFTSNNKKVVEMFLEANRALEQITEKANQLFPTSKWMLFNGNLNHHSEFTDSKMVMATINRSPICRFYYLLVHLKTVAPIIVNKHDANCDECGQAIIGHRYKCTECGDFDICQKCEAKSLHSEHAMLRIVNPVKTRIPSYITYNAPRYVFPNLY